jgi:hypothetical protein
LFSKFAFAGLLIIETLKYFGNISAKNRKVDEILGIKNNFSSPSVWKSATFMTIRLVLTTRDSHFWYDRLSEKRVLSDHRQINQLWWEELLAREFKNSETEFWLGEPPYAPSSPNDFDLFESLEAVIILINSGGNTLLNLSKWLWPILRLQRRNCLLPALTWTLEHWTLWLAKPETFEHLSQALVFFHVETLKSWSFSFF